MRWGVGGGGLWIFMRLPSLDKRCLSLSVHKSERRTPATIAKKCSQAKW